MSWLALPGVNEFRSVFDVWDRLLCQQACSNAEAAVHADLARRAQWREWAA